MSVIGFEAVCHRIRETGWHPWVLPVAGNAYQRRNAEVVTAVLHWKPSCDDLL